jgi:hypothetical protein
VTIPLCQAWKPGAAFSVAFEYTDAVTAVGVGRVVAPFYPIEAWNNTSECPFPGGNAANYDAIVKKGGVDTLYHHGGVCNACGCDQKTLLNDTLAPAGLKAVVALSAADVGRLALTKLDGIAAFATGDESDGQVFGEVSDTDKRLVSIPARKAEQSEALWARHPEVPTFNGGKTSKNIGTFAGMADIQGMDFYIGACAPRITPAPGSYPLRGPYDFLRNTRENHMPLPTWLYSQGLSPAWKKKLLIVEFYANPAPQEIYVQAFHVLAAGAKGMLWFQVNQDRAKDVPSAWQAIARSNAMIRRVRGWLREGDITGAARSSGKALVEAIRAREAIVVPILNENTTKTVDDSCNLAISDAAMPHFEFGSQSLDIEVPIPADFGLKDVFEITPTGPVDVANVSIAGRTVKVGGVAVDNTTPVRLLVLAATKTARTQAK